MSTSIGNDGWRCELFTSRRAARDRFGFVPVGAMWPAVATEDHAPDAAPSIEQWCTWYAPAVGRRYLREHQQVRPPVFVKLPDGTEFCIDFCSSSEIHAGGGEGWGCAGMPPHCTLTPSINIIGSYHGWLTDGRITPDCEGRQFPNAIGIDEAIAGRKPSA